MDVALSNTSERKWSHFANPRRPARPLPPTGMLLIDLLTILLVSTQCVSDFSKEKESADTGECRIDSRCCSRGLTNIDFAQSRKLTQLVAAPDKCLPSDIVLAQLHNYTNAPRQSTAEQPSRQTPLVAIRHRRAAHVRRVSLNTTISSAPQNHDEVAKTSRPRDEFRTMRKFHFGKEVPVLGILVCVAFYCVLIAISCTFLHYEDQDNLEEDGEEVENVEAFEENHSRQVQATQTQKSSVTVAVRVDRSVQTAPHSETPLIEVFPLNVGRPHQSEC